MPDDQILEIKIPDIKEIQKRLKDQQDKAPTVMSRAINKTITEVSKLMAKEAQEHYIVKAGAAKKTLRVRKSNKSSLSGEVLSSSGEKVKLFGFKVSPTKPKPASPPAFYKSQVRRDSGLKCLGGSEDRSAAFVAVMKSGHKGIFERQAGARRRSPRKGRPNDEPIAELYGMSIPYMFGTKRLSDTILDKGQAFLHKALDETITQTMEAAK